MENLYQTRQLIIDLRRAREADACRHRLVKGDGRSVGRGAEPCERRSRVSVFARHSLARS
jgi:hypothetical protein